jgi:hypothetical protein
MQGKLINCVALLKKLKAGRKSEESQYAIATTSVYTGQKYPLKSPKSFDLFR